MNFYNPDHQEAIDAGQFGLCDDQNGTQAYTDTAHPNEWIAEVHNGNRKVLIFTAVDKGVIQDDEEPGRGRCDGMLTFSNEYIYFIELKDQARSWISDAIEQLESTIRFFIEHHDLSVYRHKKAFACNKQHRRFQEIDNELNLRFFRQYGVRIDVQSTIIII